MNADEPVICVIRTLATGAGGRRLGLKLSQLVWVEYHLGTDCNSARGAISNKSCHDPTFKRQSHQSDITAKTAMLQNLRKYTGVIVRFASLLDSGEIEAGNRSERETRRQRDMPHTQPSSRGVTAQRQTQPTSTRTQTTSNDTYNTTRTRKHMR